MLGCWCKLIITINTTIDIIMCQNKICVLPLETWFCTDFPSKYLIQVKIMIPIECKYCFIFV